jgi:hypothetical protein
MRVRGLLSRIRPAPAWRRSRLSAALLSLLCAGPAIGADLYHAGDFDVRWDNTLRYTAAFRLFPQDRELISNPNWDDGDRNFDPGAISNRFDLISELDITDGDYGLRVSGAAWYDTVYHQKNDNDSPTTFNPFSVPHNEFTRAVRGWHGEDVELGDLFFHGSFDVGGAPVSFRVGRYTLLWGESLFFGDNSISAGQAPTDETRELAQPSDYAKDVFLPVWQASATVQLGDNVSLSGYYQFAWRKDRLTGSGSYFSYADYQGPGGERIILSPGHFLYRERDLRAPDSGQFGMSLQVSGDEFNYGFYALKFNAKEPQVYLYPGAPSRGDGLYRLVYPTGVELYGASASTYLGDSNVAGEFSYRRNMPLVSEPVVVPSRVHADGSDHSLYAVGDTLHGQVSSVTTFGASPLWERADLAVEVAANDRLSVENRAALDPSRDRFAMAFQANFTPQYFEVLPALDVSVPIGFGYGLVGDSSTDENQYARAGNFEIGIAATFRAVWHGGLSFTHFIGTAEQQPLADRDFVMLSLQRTL